MHKITRLQMIDYGDRIRTQQEAVSRLWSCKADKKGAVNAISEEIKLNVMLVFGENAHYIE